MKSAIDPFTGSALCGSCGALYATSAGAEQCCAPENDVATWRAIFACLLVMASLVFTFVVLPLL